MANSSTSQSQQIYYNDIYLNPNAISSGSDLLVLNNVAAIQTSINNILMSYNKETPMMEENGIDANIFGFLFAPLDISNALMIREYVKSALELNEPRIDNIYVNVVISEPQSGYIINIYYNIVNSNNNTQQTTVFLKNVR